MCSSLTGAGTRQVLIILSTVLLGGMLGGSVCALGIAAHGPGGFPFALCPTSCPPTPQAAFAHLALAFRCDTFTLQQRVQVEKRARDAAEENIQEELGQCRAALEVGGHEGRGLASAGDFQLQRGLDNSESWLQQLHPPSLPPQRLGPSCTDAGCREMLEQLQRSLTVLAAAIERATSAAEKLGAVHQVCASFVAPHRGWEGWRVLRLGLGTHPWVCWGLSLLLPVLALTSRLHVQGCKGSACPWEQKGDAFASPGWRHHGVHSEGLAGTRVLRYQEMGRWGA